MTPTSSRIPPRDIVLALLAFSAAYMLLNSKLLIAKILYRLVAYDYLNPILSAVAFAVQAGLLLFAICFLSRSLFVALLAAVAASGLMNVAYGEVLQTYPDSSALSWMLSEVRQATTALREFWPQFLLASVRVGLSLCLFSLVRRLLRPIVVAKGWPLARSGYAGTGILVALCLLPEMLFARINLPQGAELNAYPMALDALLVSHPHRMPVPVDPVEQPRVEKIIWLVDESISHTHFEQVVMPTIYHLSPLDFGETASMGNCSATSNAALRWGVDVQTVGQRTDLRQTPTIWAYAKHSGFHTTLIDGQVLGAPQNMIWEPELRLIDDVFAARSDLLTDRRIASQVNAILKRPGRDFAYVVLRGAHYAYESNYPLNALPSDSPLESKYRKAIAFSKSGFFETLTRDVDRRHVAMFYTSDHGQIIVPGVTPHCNDLARPEEFAVPLIAFLPDLEGMESWRTQHALRGRKSHSQIFPTTLVLMGYDKSYAENNYDHMLGRDTKNFVWFGKAIVPDKDGGIVVWRADRFPMR